LNQEKYMASPVKLYQKQMHNNVGFFATWLPSSTLELGDLGVLEAGRFRRVGSLAELGISIGSVRESNPENMSYSAWAEKKTATSAGAGTAVPIAKAELAIQFSQQGGYVFEAVAIRNVEIADRLNLTRAILDLYEQGRWQKEWLLVDALYKADSATIIVSEDSASGIVLNASTDTPLGSLPLANPKVALSVSSVTGKVVHVVAQSGLSPLYSCLKVQAPFFGKASLSPVRGTQSNPADAFARCGIEDLLDS
jgi:hypothetical protein